MPCFALAAEAFKSWPQCDDHHSAMKNWESRGVNTNLDSQDFGALQLHQRLSSQVSRGPHLVCAQAMRDQPSGQRPSSSRAGRGQTRWRSAPATTPAPGLRRDELKLLAGAACASLARCAHSLTSPATTPWSPGSPLRLWPGWIISRSQAKGCDFRQIGGPRNTATDRGHRLLVPG